MEYSSLTTYEYISIIANYNRISKSDTEQKLIDRGFTPAQIKAALKDKSFKQATSLNVTFTEANNWPLSEFGFYLSLHQAYQHGTPPFPGSPIEQPAKIMEVFNVLDSLQAEAEQRARKQANKENKQRVK
jgi:hypothetical protein